MDEFPVAAQCAVGAVLIVSAIGVLAVEKPIHASLSFLITLMALAVAYAGLSAGFIAAVQILVYAGAILVIFVFVIVLFQDAYLRISRYPPKSRPFGLLMALLAFGLALWVLAQPLLRYTPVVVPPVEGYGSVQALGKALYVDCFFPFEAVVLLFLVAAIGSLYIAKRGE